MAVGLKTLLEAAQYLEEQEQQQNSPLSSNHLNGVSNHLNNETNTSCFIAHYSLAVAGNRNAAAAAAPTAVNGTTLQTVGPTTSTTILNDENQKSAIIEGFFANGHSGIDSTSAAAADLFATRKSTCQNIVKNTGNKKQQNIATSAPATTTTGFQQVAAFGNGFSLTTKTKSPTELFISGDRKDVHETNNNCSKGQLVSGAIIQQQQQQQQLINNHHSTLPTNTNTSNILNSSANNNNNNNHHKVLTTSNKATIINNNNDDFDSNSLSPPGPQRVRSASTSSNVYVFGSLDHAKSAANHANRLQANVLHANADGKGLQMMLVNEANGANNIASWMINNHSPQRNNSMEGVSSSQMDVISPKNFTNITGTQSHMSISSIGSNGRRRTMSSTSNGAGTREVHNKLEKNRRAHLKECYEKLKSQLNLKDEDRKKTSNLAVLGEALSQVMALQKKDQELEAKIEQLAKDKINSQKRIVTLKRELGARYEQIFSGIFPDSEITMTSIPNERDNFNNMACLSSGRGSVLYSSSNSLSSSGGSSCNNTLLSSPGGVNHLQTNSTTIIPVIPKNNTAANKLSGIGGNTLTTTTSLSAVSKNGDIFLQQQQQQQQQQQNNNNNINKMATTNNASNNLTSSPGSPSSSTVLGVNNLVISTTATVNNLPLSLTAKNISDTSLTRGSPTPSTPSPSPSSSSGVSSSSSFISSSPPIVNSGGNSNGNGNNSTTQSVSIVNGNGNGNGNGVNCTTATATTAQRQVCINIPNGLKFHVANNSGIGIGNGSSGVVNFQNTIGNIATTAAITKNCNYHP